jgi:nucleoside-diphosphate-sugar epimerase
MLVHAPVQPGSLIHEGSLVEPKWDYPKAKWDAEQIIRERGQALRPVILRIAGVYDDGCHSPPLANQIQRIFERRLVSRVFPGEVSHGQAFVHLDDVVGAFERLLGIRRELGHAETFLIGEPQTVSYDELQRTLGGLIHGEEWVTTQIPKAIAKAGAWVEEHVPGEEPFIKPWMIDLADDHFELDISRAREALGWDPVRALRASLPRMIERLRADPARFYEENKLEAPGWLKRQFDAAPVSHAPQAR